MSGLQQVMDPELRDLLARHRLTTVAAIANVASPHEELEDVWAEITQNAQQHDHLYTNFKNTVDLARTIAARKRRQDAAEPRVVIEAKRLRCALDAQKKVTEDYILRQGLAPYTLPPPAAARARTVWRSSLGPLGPGTTGGLTAAASEGAKRDKYVAELVDVLIGIDCPSARAAADTGDLRGTLALAAGGRRASTLRTRLRAWNAFARWMKIAHDEAWIKHWGRVVEYARMRAEEPCGRQTLQGILWSIAFVNRAAGYAPIDNTFYKSSCQELLASVSARAGGGTGRSAPTTLALHLACLESMVMDDEMPVWLRSYCAWKCTQCWAATRFDDHRGIRPDRLEWQGDNLRLHLHRTKTTGQGKRVEARVIGISHEAYLMEERWMRTGWDLLARMGRPDRDYLLAAPTPDLTEGRDRELRYHEASAWSRAAYRKLSAALGYTEEQAEMLGQHFSEHSGRSFLVTAAMALGATDAYLQPIGGWGARTSQKYMHTAVERMWSVQGEVARQARGRWKRDDAIGETGKVQELARYFASQGLDKAAADAAASLSNAFPDGAVTVEIWGRAQHDESFNAGGGTERSGGGASASSWGGAPGTEPPVAETAAVPPRCFDDARLPKHERGYVVSISGKRGFRRLHRLGGCHRVPGIDYQEYELLGDDFPTEEAYDAHCAQCWRDTDPAQEAAAARSENVEMNEEHAVDHSTDASSSTELDG